MQGSRCLTMSRRNARFVKRRPCWTSPGTRPSILQAIQARFLKLDTVTVAQLAPPPAKCCSYTSVPRPAILQSCAACCTVVKLTSCRASDIFSNMYCNRVSVVSKMLTSFKRRSSPCELGQQQQQVSLLYALTCTALVTTS